MITCIFVLGLFFQSGCSGDENKNLTKIKLWHSYEAEQRKLFESMVDLYNSTEGAENNTFVFLEYKSEEEIDNNLNSNIKSLKKSEEYPEISFISGETANKANAFNLLVCAENYLTESQLVHYFSGFLNEGRITGANETYIFPITKKVDCLIINGSEWSDFYRSRDVSVEDWNTWDGLEKLGEKYYSWSEGKALFAFENLENFIYAYTAQKLPVLVQTGYNEIKINTNKEVLKGVWDIYYNGVVKGYISQTEDINSAIENREIIAYIGAHCGRNELPAQYITQNGTKNTMAVTSSSYPVINYSRNIIPQTGYGVAVFDHGEEVNAKCYNFLNWFCTNEMIIDFSFTGNEIASCKSVYNKVAFNNYINEKYLEDHIKTYMLSTSIEQLKEGSSYGAVEFVGFDSFSEALELSLIEISAQGREKVEKLMEEGMLYSEALSSIDSDSAFEEWYNHIVTLSENY